MSNNVRPASMERITNFELAQKFIDEQVAEVRAQVGDKKVLLALSGGVDSSVVAALLIKAIGKQLVCVHVNHGLMRKNESEGVIKMFKDGLDANLIYVDATDHFLGLLAGVSDPERKRKIIGKEFITVFADEARKLEGISFLAQGTIYPDILESIKAAEGKKAALEVDGSKGSSYVVNINRCNVEGFAAGEFTGEPMFNIEGGEIIARDEKVAVWHFEVIMMIAAGNAIFFVNFAKQIYFVETGHIVRCIRESFGTNQKMPVFETRIIPCGLLIKIPTHIAVNIVGGG